MKRVMGFRPSRRTSLTVPKALKLANMYLDNARNEDDSDIVLVLCHDTEITLSQAKPKNAEDRAFIQRIATAYNDLGKLLEKHKDMEVAQSMFKKERDLR